MTNHKSPFERRLHKRLVNKTYTQRERWLYRCSHVPVNHLKCHDTFHNNNKNSFEHSHTERWNLLGPTPLLAVKVREVILRFDNTVHMVLSRDYAIQDIKIQISWQLNWMYHKSNLSYIIYFKLGKITEPTSIIKITHQINLITAHQNCKRIGTAKKPHDSLLSRNTSNGMNHFLSDTNTLRHYI